MRVTGLLLLAALLTACSGDSTTSSGSGGAGEDSAGAGGGDVADGGEAGDSGGPGDGGAAGDGAGGEAGEGGTPFGGGDGGSQGGDGGSSQSGAGGVQQGGMSGAPQAGASQAGQGGFGLGGSGQAGTGGVPQGGAGAGGAPQGGGGVPQGGSAGTSQGGTAGAGGVGGGGVVGDCDYTPTLQAATRELIFDRITLPFATTPSGKTNDGINGLTHVAVVPGTSNEFLLIQKGGGVQHVSLDADSTQATLIRSYAVTQVNTRQDCGLVSIAFDPDFDENRLIYFGHCDTPDSTMIARYTLTDEALTDRQVIHTWTRASGSNSWHTIGSIGFDADKNLWAMHGEFTGGAVSQNDASDLGKLLKLVPNRLPGQGGAEPAGTVNGHYAKGLRVPWRAFTNSHGDIVFADVGNNSDEEINVVTAPGQNFGWDGSVSGSCNAPCVSPLTFWHNGGNESQYRSDGNPVTGARAGRTAWLGIEYGNCGNDRYAGSMTGVATFGDFFAGWVRGMVITGAGQMTLDEHLGHLTTVSSWVQAPDGYLYVTAFGGPYDSANAESDVSGLFRAVLED